MATATHISCRHSNTYHFITPAAQDHPHATTVRDNALIYLLLNCLLSPTANRRGGQAARRGYSIDQCVCVCVCNTFTVYTITRKNTGAMSFNFLWALSELLTSMSLHLGSVALPQVLRRGSVLVEHSCCTFSTDRYWSHCHQ